MARSGRSRAARLILVLAAVGLVPAALGSGVAAASNAKVRSYIVVLKPNTAAPTVAAEHARTLDAEVTQVYRHALQGYAARLSPQAVDRLRQDARVAYVEVDGTMSVSYTQSPAPWGLDRIDQRNLPLSGSYTFFTGGAGVTAYILDTGIRLTHNDFTGRAVSGFDAVDPGTSADDCHGHGTHVAGTTGGRKYGVAKAVSLVAVRVLDCGGSAPNSIVIAGVDWVTGDHDPGENAVANMSLGGPASAAMDTAVRNSIADGVAYAVAAGNGNIFGQPVDACTKSPARVLEAMTVSATNKNDTRASWANFGNCVNWFAPGVNVISAWYTSDTATNVISGTSMATPHTTGVAALYLQANPGSTPAQVEAGLAALTTKAIVNNSMTANDDLLFTNF
jgi:subtilisin family serine protease